LQAGLWFLIVFAPLLRGGYTPAATLLLQWLSLGLLVLVVWQSRPVRLRGVEVTFLGLLFAVPALYLIPLPAVLAHWLPARELYVQAHVLVDGALTGPLRLSVYPLATELSWMMLVVPIGVYLAARVLSERMKVRLVYVFFGIALAQVLIALFQFATAGGVSYSLVELLGRSGSSGTYVNRNHLAGMIEMALPLALAMFLYDFGGTFTANRRRTGLRERVVAILKSSNRPSWIFVLLAVLFTIGVIVTRSRTGIAMGMLGILLTTVLFSRRVGGRGTFGLMGQLVTISIGVAIFLGLAPVLDRFSVAELDADARWPMAVASFDAAGRLLPFGSGPGTYPDVFALYQPLELGRWFINYAHNDYIQALFEMGLPGVLLLALFLILYAAQWPRLVTAEEWSRFRSLQIGAGLSMLLLLLHGLTDNNLQNPANLVYFAMLAGLFFSPPGMPRLSERQRRRRRRTVTLVESPGLVVKGDAGGEGAEVAPSRRRSQNPFDD
jgi:O-antigen ligase